MTRMDLRKTHRLGMAAVIGLEGYSRTHLPKRLYELVKLRASELNQCRFCIAMHTEALRKDGEREERIEALAREDVPTSLFDERELAALRLADELTRIDPELGVSDETWEAAAAQFGESELGSLVIGIATINVFNRMNIATRLEA